MRPPEVRKYLFDIWQACELLAEFSRGRTLEEYQGDALLRSAIERQFEIVGEALNQAIKLDADVAKQVSDSGRIIAFRNRLIHAYSAVSNEVVWGVIEAYLPRLRLEVQRLLETGQ
jgi:uncharacterized protein with HEPN domain